MGGLSEGGKSGRGGDSAQLLGITPMPPTPASASFFLPASFVLFSGRSQRRTQRRRPHTPLRRDGMPARATATHLSSLRAAFAGRGRGRRQKQSSSARPCVACPITANDGEIPTLSVGSVRAGVPACRCTRSLARSISSSLCLSVFLLFLASPSPPRQSHGPTGSSSAQAPPADVRPSSLGDTAQVSWGARGAGHASHDLLEAGSWRYVGVVT